MLWACPNVTLDVGQEAKPLDFELCNAYHTIPDDIGHGICVALHLGAQKPILGASLKFQHLVSSICILNFEPCSSRRAG